MDRSSLAQKIKELVDAKRREMELLGRIDPEKFIESLEKLKEISGANDVMTALNYAMYLPFDMREQVDILRRLIELDLSGMAKTYDMISAIYQSIGNKNVIEPKPYKNFGEIMMLIAMLYSSI